MTQTEVDEMTIIYLMKRLLAAIGIMEFNEMHKSWEKIK